MGLFLIALIVYTIIGLIGLEIVRPGFSDGVLFWWGRPSVILFWPLWLVFVLCAFIYEWIYW